MFELIFGKKPGENLLLDNKNTLPADSDAAEGPEARIVSKIASLFDSQEVEVVSQCP